MDARAYLAERAALLDPFLDAALPPADAPPAALHAAMRHLLFPGGKRLRPGLAFAGCEAAGSPPERALPLAAAVELVHVYSLVHDDLPCMDDDAWRRGQPTVHVAFGEATAVLAGDALLALAFEVLLRAGAGAPGATLAAARALARAAGPGHLVGGQADDLGVAPGAGADEAERVESVHRRKTAALIAAAVSGGARLGGADDALAARLHRFGEQVGVAFQIADDLLDAGGDGRESCSLVRVLGAGRARERAEALLAAALESIRDLPERAEPLRELARAAVRRDR
jgi:geranylgeranyl diphosphate synthase type II